MRIRGLLLIYIPDEPGETDSALSKQGFAKSRGNIDICVICPTNSLAPLATPSLDVMQHYTVPEFIFLPKT